MPTDNGTPRRRFLESVSVAGASLLAGCSLGDPAGKQSMSTPACDPPLSESVRQPSGDAGGWPMIQGGPSHAGNGPPGPDGPDVRWEVQTCRGVSAPPAVVDGRVFVASNDTNLYAFDAATGTTLWANTEGEFVGSSPAVVDGHVFVGARDGVYALDAASGERVWRASPSVTGGDITVAGGLVCLAGRTLVALDTATGTKQWSAPAGMNSSTPAMDGDHLYIAAEESLTSYGLDGTRQWTVDIGHRVLRSIPAVVEDTVYVGVRGGIVAVGRDGTERWRYWPTPDDLPRMTKPLAVSDGLVYALHWNTPEQEKPMDFNIACIALDGETGTEQWRAGFDTLTYSDGGGPGVDLAPPVVGDDTVYFGLYGQVLALNASTGTERWRFDPPAPQAGRRGYWRLSPLALAAGTLYTGNWKGTVSALG